MTSIYFFITPFIILSPLAAYFVLPLLCLLFFFPIGSLSFPLSFLILSHMMLFGLFPHFSFMLSNTMMIAVIVALFSVALILKFAVHRSLKRHKLGNYPASIIVVLTTLLFSLITSIVAKIIAPYLDVIAIAELTSVLLFNSLSIDLTVFSYVKYRDAIKGIISRVWVSWLAILWSTVLWMPYGMYLVLFFSPSIYITIEWDIYGVLMTIAWIAVTVLQITYAIISYKQYKTNT
ncbi:hypothetical protein J4526_08995 [Desulfurococcaceae archaeon MEX13E-LK6-19]|nr:hypothetical protein J4526_08995 [Desulfurococcaceae archaeon MEX13E-LK6-19]